MTTLSKFLRYFAAITCGLCLNSVTFADDNQRTQISVLNYNKLLKENDFSSNPLVQLTAWIDKATKDHVSYPKTAQLATVKADGSPAIRTMGVKKITTKGIIFSTNPLSNKVKQFTHSPKVALLLVWHDSVLHVSRQVIVEGSVSVYAPKKMINFKLHTGNASVPTQRFIIQPTHIEFSQIQRINDDRVVEYITYNKTKNHWVKTPGKDYLTRM